MADIKKHGELLQSLNCPDSGFCERSFLLAFIPGGAAAGCQCPFSAPDQGSAADPHLIQFIQLINVLTDAFQPFHVEHNSDLISGKKGIKLFSACDQYHLRK